MPKINEMMPSRFLKKEDCGTGILLTIAGVQIDNVGTKDAPDEKWTMLFEENKPMVLNSTNMQLCAKICGSDDTDDWRGKKVVAYDDPNVSFGGKLVGGVRLRAPRTKHPVVANPKPAPMVADMDDDVPFLLNVTMFSDPYSNRINRRIKGDR
jgi:hypothetical protein